MREVRAQLSPTQEDGKVRGYAALYDSWSRPISERGKTFREKIAPGALVPADGGVSLWWMHDSKSPLANEKSGTLKITSDERGIAFEADLGTSPRANEIRDLVRRGVVSEMSIGFTAEADSWSGTASRTVTRATLHEVSLVEQAAYGGTYAEVRQGKRNMSLKENRAKIADLRAEYATAEDERQLAILEEINEVEERIASEKAAFEAKIASPAAAFAKPATRAASPARDSQRDWFRGGFRQERAIGINVGSTTLTTNAMMPSLASEFIKALDQESVLRQLATVETRGVDTDIPVISNRMTAALVAEGGSYTSQELSATKVSFKSYKTAFYTDVSEEALQDTVWDLAAQVVAEHGRAHGRKWEDLYANGTNTNQPQGVFTAAWTATQTSTTSLTLPTMDDMVTAAFKLNPAYFGSSCWLMNQAVWANLVKSASSGKYLLNGENANILRDGAVALLLGRPVYLTEFGSAATTANNTVALFGDLKRGYRIIDRASVNFTVDDMSQAVSGNVRYSSRMRSDGRAVDLAACVKIAVKA